MTVTPLQIEASSILMLKSHSAGIGDILRSSAAWRVLHDAHPNAALHLILLTRDLGAASEELMRQHHLLTTFSAIEKRSGGLADLRRVWKSVRRLAEKTRPDLVIDFEPNGIRTSVLAWLLRRQFRAVTVGIEQPAPRRLFYHTASPASRRYAQRHGLRIPLEYSERDFVALAALGLNRNQTPIELRETPEGTLFRKGLRERFGLPENTRFLGLNIGCGTPDAVPKRPDLHLMSRVVRALQQRHGFTVLLTGARFEAEVNRAFMTVHGADSATGVIDLAGGTTLSELTGAIKACELFISSDSGPYHMSVALRVPTVAVFNWPNIEHFHQHPWVRCLPLTGQDDAQRILEATESLATMPHREDKPAARS